MEKLLKELPTALIRMFLPCSFTPRYRHFTKTWNCENSIHQIRPIPTTTSLVKNVLIFIKNTGSLFPKRWKMRWRRRIRLNTGRAVFVPLIKNFPASKSYRKPGRRMLNIISILHQTTTSSKPHCTRCQGEYHFNFTSNHNQSNWSCSHSLGEYHFNFTSNHNCCFFLQNPVQGEYHFNFTSNHNHLIPLSAIAAVNIISILHQTTTMSVICLYSTMVNIISILHQTTTNILPS